MILKSNSIFHLGALTKGVEDYDKLVKRVSPTDPNGGMISMATMGPGTEGQEAGLGVGGSIAARNTPSEPIDVTTVPHVTDNDPMSLCLNVNNKSPNNIMAEVVMNQGYNARDVQPPNTIYGIDNMQNKPYEQDVKVAPDIVQSPRYANNPHALVSPHPSSPDKENNRHTRVKHEPNASWGASPAKSHGGGGGVGGAGGYRNPAPASLTSPYVESRDPNYPRRYLPPFYGTTAANRTFTHVNDRTRYGAYPLGSPLMSTLGFTRDALDSRYNLHVNPTMGGFEEQKYKLSPPSIDDKHIWTKQEVELLLDLYEEHKSKLQDPRVRKTKVWDDIAKQIQEKLDADVNGCQCNQKFRNMKADYQKVVEHNTRSDSFRKTCKYFERLEKLLTPPVNEAADKMKMDSVGGEGGGGSGGGGGGDAKFFNGFSANQNAYGSKASTPNGTTGYYENPLSHTSSPDSSDHNQQNYENGNATSSSTTPSSPPEKRPLTHIEATTGDDASPPPAKRPCTECNCGGISKRDLIDILKEFLKEQRKREEETIKKIQLLHREKIDTVVKFLDLFQELVKKV